MGTTFNKALVALAVPLILLGLSKIGYTADQGFADNLSLVLGLLITPLLVYLTPNKPAG